MRVFTVSFFFVADDDEDEVNGPVPPPVDEEKRPFELLQLVMLPSEVVVVVAVPKVVTVEVVIVFAVVFGLVEEADVAGFDGSSLGSVCSISMCSTRQNSLESSLAFILRSALVFNKKINI
jgi:hypothetical protein